MITENFATKFFTETISLQGYGEGGIDAHLFKAAFIELSSRELSIFAENNRHERSLGLVSTFVNTPRKYHRFKYALSRRLPDLLDEVDDYDLLVIAALEACDAVVLKMLIINANEIFIQNQVTDQLKAKIDQLKGPEKEAYEILIKRDNNDALDKYLRAAAKEHWRAAFLGLGPFTSIMKWVDILSDEDEEAVHLTVRDLLTEVTNKSDQNFEIITDTLRDLFQKKYDVEKNISTICKILQEVGLTKVGALVTPTLVRIIINKLAVKDSDLRFNLLKVYLSLNNVDYSVPSRLFFYLVENQERGKVISDLSEYQIRDLARILLNGFQETMHYLDLSENNMSYLYRIKWASQYLMTEDPVIDVVISKMQVPAIMDNFVNSLLSLRHPWQPIFSDNHIEIIDKLIGIDKFRQAIDSFDYSKLNPHTITALDDFKNKFAQAKEGGHTLSSLFD